MRRPVDLLRGERSLALIQPVLLDRERSVSILATDLRLLVLSTTGVLERIPYRRLRRVAPGAAGRRDRRPAGIGAELTVEDDLGDRILVSGTAAQMRQLEGILRGRLPRPSEPERAGLILRVLGRVRRARRRAP